MNKAEFNAWKAHTEYSKLTWVLDPVHNGANGDWLFHKGGVDGQFVNVSKGKAVIGDYTGAYPHIGESSFRVLYEKQFRTNEEAFAALANRGQLELENE